MVVKEATKESVMESMAEVRRHAALAFKFLNKLHEIMQEDCTIDLGDSRIDYVIKGSDPKIKAWLKEFNEHKLKFVEEPEEGEEAEPPEDLSMSDAMDAITYFTTLLLYQIIPYESIREACMHHNQHAEGDEGSDKALHGIAKAIADAISSGALPKPSSLKEDPFKDVAEIAEGAAVVVPTRGPLD